MVREDGLFGVEEVKVWGPNVLSFQLHVGQKEEERWHCVGAYLPPSNKAGEAQRLLTAAIREVPEGARLMMLVDLNADLDPSWGRQEDVLAAEADKNGLVCATKQFQCRRKRWPMRGRWTFRRPNYTPEGERRWICGKPNYALVRARDQRRVQSFRWVAMRHHDSDYRALVMRVETDPEGVKRYEKDRRTPPSPLLALARGRNVRGAGGGHGEAAGQGAPGERPGPLGRAVSCRQDG